MKEKLSNLRKKRGRMRGFTLIELMIVVVVVGILAAIAYPSYQNQVRKSKRADGKAELLETAQELERCYTRFGRYNDGNCDVALPFMSGEGHYEVDGSVNAASFVLNAAPQGAQADDAECGTLRVTSTGLQGSQNADTDANDCW
jgi:type IV pilus assembly protein PilE